MKDGMKTRFLSCKVDGPESFLSCALRNKNPLLTTSNDKRKNSCALTLPCISANPSEGDAKTVNRYGACKLIVGIDPGITGAIAFVKTGTLPRYHAVYDLPTFEDKKGKKRIDLEDFALLISTYSEDVSLVLIEEVGQIGTKADPFSSFVFGFATGGVHGVIAAFNLPIKTVKPLVWKGLLGLSADKEQSLEKARKFFPEAADKLKRKMDHGRAEALLLAYFAAKMGAR